MLSDAAQFAHKRNIIKEYRCRPFLHNDSLNKIKNDYKKYILQDYHDVLLQYNNDVLVGVTGVFWMEEDNYLSISRGIFAEGNYDEVAKGFLEYLKRNFSGYKLYINTAKEHTKSIDFYNINGFELLEDAVLYNLYDFSASEFDTRIQDINETNCNEIYNYLSAIMTEDTYWNIERLSKNIDKFIVLGYFDEEIKGAIYAQIYSDNTVEIFSIRADDFSLVEIMMNALAKKCQTINAEKLMLYTEDDKEVQVAIKLGYCYFDSNVCFLKKLNNDVN